MLPFGDYVLRKPSLETGGIGAYVLGAHEARLNRLNLRTQQKPQQNSAKSDSTNLSNSAKSQQTAKLSKTANLSKFSIEGPSGKGPKL
jgi:hypothetical protein